jgi:hypothetical protein
MTSMRSSAEPATGTLTVGSPRLERLVSVREADPVVAAARIP